MNADLTSGVKFLIGLQLFARLLTTSLNQILLRHTSPSVLGVAQVQLELVLALILFGSREAFRCALMRSSNDIKDGKRDDIRSFARRLQLTVNASYLPALIGCLIVVSISVLSRFLSTTLTSTTDRPSILALTLFCVAAILELLTEPFYIQTQKMLMYRARVLVEGLAILVRCSTVLIFTLSISSTDHDEMHHQGVLAFAYGQLAFSLCLMLGYSNFFHSTVFRPQHLTAIYGPIVAPIEELNSWSDLLPRRVDSGKWLDSETMSLTYSMYIQSAVKLMLTEGDKILLSVVGSSYNQGVYALVSNYGSILVRIVFLPIEEMSRNLFSKLLGQSSNKTALVESKNILETILSLHLFLGCIFIAFGPQYTSTFIQYMAGPQWTHTDAAWTLGSYCLLIPVLGVNGITEAFVYSVADKTQTLKITQNLVAFFFIYATIGYSLLVIFKLGTTGLILANVINMTMRIVLSWNFIRDYFGIQKGITAKSFWSLSPSIFTLLSFVSSSLVLYLLEWNAPGSSHMDHLKHLICGALLGIGCLIVAHMNDDLRAFYDLRKARKRK